jgi:hypothetical protein
MRNRLSFQRVSGIVSMLYRACPRLICFGRSDSWGCPAGLPLLGIRPHPCAIHPPKAQFQKPTPGRETETEGRLQGLDTWEFCAALRCRFPRQIGVAANRSTRDSWSYGLRIRELAVRWLQALRASALSTRPCLAAKPEFTPSYPPVWRPPQPRAWSGLRAGLWVLAPLSLAPSLPLSLPPASYAHSFAYLRVVGWHARRIARMHVPAWLYVWMPYRIRIYSIQYTIMSLVASV